MTTIHHWRFEDGVTPMNPGNPFGESIAPRGWYCWVYTASHDEYLEWMAEFCPTSDCTSRFNSGNPMITTYIKDDKEATLFQLKWM